MCSHSAYNALEQLLGDRCSVDIDDRTTHGNDAYSYHRDKPPWAIVYPQSTDEVSQIAKICSKYHIPMIPYGSGTSLEGHTTAPSGGVVIEMSRMDRIKQLHEADMDVVVEPGITWSVHQHLFTYTATAPQLAALSSTLVTPPCASSTH